MGRRKRKEEHEGDGERWLLTYADLITLLMVFFIILYSMSNIDAAKYEAMANSLKVAMGEQPQGTGLVSQMMKGTKPGNEKELTLTGRNIGKSATTKEILNTRNPKEEREFNQIIKEVKEYAEQKGLKNVEAKLEARGVVINLSDKVLFESGKADLSASAKATLDALAAILFATERQIKVEGHTDNVPISNERYPSNWQLSTDRATSVIMYWLSKHPSASDKLSAAGYGEHRPVEPNTTLYGRGKNRRVEIIVLRELLSVIEPEADSDASADEAAATSEKESTVNTDTSNAIDLGDSKKALDLGEQLPVDMNVDMKKESP